MYEIGAVVAVVVVFGIVVDVVVVLAIVVDVVVVLAIVVDVVVVASGTVDGVVTDGSSGMAGLANTLLSATTGCEGVATSTTIAKTTTTSTTIPKTTTTVAQTTTTTTTIPKTTTTTVPNSYKVGDKGPSGGIIIYVDLARPVGSRFFEAACAGWSDGTCGGSDLIDPKATWGCPASMLAGADGQGIGAGKQNTIGIVAGCADPGIAARLADVLVLGGQSDWFLPSREELNEVYKLNASIGGFSSDFYWSSFQYRPDVGFAWGRFFSAAPRLSDWKKNLNYVRPVRSF